MSRISRIVLRFLSKLEDVIIHGANPFVDHSSLYMSDIATTLPSGGWEVFRRDNER
jgi:hypothetical protein